MTFDLERVRKDFPILSREVNSRPPVSPHSAASSQPPAAGIEATGALFVRNPPNVHRGIYVLAEEATALFEGARDAVAALLNAFDRSEVVFTKNATEALNLVARSVGDSGRIKPGDEIVVTEMEHHSNIVPWQLLAA